MTSTVVPVVRALRRRPAFALFTALTLGLGIGLSVALWSLVSAVLREPLPWPEADRMVQVRESHRPGDSQRSVSPKNLEDWRARQQAFSAIAGILPRRATLTGHGEPRQLENTFVGPGFFAVLGVEPQWGRSFTEAEMTPDGPRAVVLSHALWTELFGARFDGPERSLELDGHPHPVVGVLPPGTAFPEGTRLWRPLRASFDHLPRDAHFLEVYARLAPGVDLAVAQRDLDRISAAIAADDPGSETGFGALAVPLLESVVGDSPTWLGLLAAAVGTVFLVSCINVAGLLMLRVAGRRGELAVRLALRARRRDLAAQLMTEALVLAGLGAGLGLLIAVWGTHAFAALARGFDLPRVETLAVDGSSLALAVGLATLATLGAGIGPALVGAQTSSWTGPGPGRGALSSRRDERWKSILVGAQVALASSLLVLGGLLVRSFAVLAQSDPGFRVDGVAAVELDLGRARYPEPAERLATAQRIVDRVGALPGVVAAGTTSWLPFEPDDGLVWELEADPTAAEGGDRPIEVDIAAVGPGLLEALGLRLLAGRPPGPGDTPASAQVALVNRGLAVRLAGSPEAAIGREVRLAEGLGIGERPGWRVVGVVDDIRLEGLDETSAATLYLPSAQTGLRTMHLVLRTALDPASVYAPLRAAIWEIDPHLPLTPRTLDSLIVRSTARPRAFAGLVGTFAGVSLALAAVGLFSLLATAVSEKRREIALRVAVGADRRAIRSWILGRTLRLMLTGCAAGILLVVLLRPLVARVLYGVGVLDPVNLLAVVGTIVAVGVLAGWTPVRRALAIEPALALREE